MPPRVRVLHSDRYACDIGRHVFPTAKYRMTLDALLAAGAIRPGDVAEPRMPAREALGLVHAADYLDDLEQLRWTPRTMYSELPLSEAISDAYRLAAGGTIDAARAALDGMAAVHLGGGFHHAFAARAEGFCYVNDLAVAIRVMQHEGRIVRAAVVDLDVHQGNGTARIFEGDDSVFTLSIHQARNYPAFKENSDLDVGLDDGTGDDAYLQALAGALERVWAAAPELVLYQAGADPYVHDQLGGLALSFDGLERRDRAVLGGCAARGVPAVVTLGGGYARDVRDTVRIHATTARVAIAAHAGATARP